MTRENKSPELQWFRGAFYLLCLITFAMAAALVVPETPALVLGRPVAPLHGSGLLPGIVQ